MVYAYTQRVCGQWLHMKSVWVMVVWEECVGDGYVGGVLIDGCVCRKWLNM